MFVAPRLPLTSAQFFVYLRYFLLYIVGYKDIDSETGVVGNTWGELASGINGSTDSTEQIIFRDLVAIFNVSYAGKYLAVYNSNLPANNGIFKIISVIDDHTLVLANTPYGPKFSTDINLSWIVFDVDTAINVNADTFFVVRAGNNTSPAWECVFKHNQTTFPDCVECQLSPLGGWNPGVNNWQFGVPVGVSRFALYDTGRKAWYVVATDSTIVIWSENLAGTGVHNMVYLGACQTFRPQVDSSFAVSAGPRNFIPVTPGTSPADIFAEFDSTDVLNTSIVPFSSVKPCTAQPTGVVTTPLFDGLKNSDFDFRRDTSVVPVVNGSTNADSEIRGVLSFVFYCSTLIPYKSFVNNNRTLVSLGNGMCVSWTSNLLLVLSCTNYSLNFDWLLSASQPQTKTTRSKNVKTPRISTPGSNPSPMACTAC